MKKVYLARNFRKYPTKSEKLFWNTVRNRQINHLKFRRQHIIEGFIADFYCAEKNLVVEIEGSIHENKKQKKYDEERFAVYKDRGLNIYKIKSVDLENNLPGVINKLKHYLEGI